MIIFNVLESKFVIISSVRKLNRVVYLLWIIALIGGFASCNLSNEPRTTIFYTHQNLKISADSIYTLAGSLFSGTIVSSTIEQKNEKYYSILNGKLHGPYKEWTPEYILKTDKHYKLGEEHGLQKGYHHNGNLSYSYKTINGRRDGLYQEFYPSGQLHIEKKYKKGKQVSNKIKTPQCAVIANYVWKNGRNYGLMGSSLCFSVIEENSNDEN